MEPNYKISKLSPVDFKKCGNIWDMDKQADLAEKFYNELLSGNRVTYIYQINGEFIGEISLVLDMNDNDYTVKGQRIYLSRLIVKKEYRRKGIGKKLVEIAVLKAKEMGYCELSIGVDLENFAALKLYFEAGFNTVLYIGEDKDGQYAKLLMKIH